MGKIRLSDDLYDNTKVVTQAGFEPTPGSHNTKNKGNEISSSACGLCREKNV